MLFLIMSIHVLLNTEVDAGSPGAIVTGSHELACGCCELNLGFLQEEGVLLATEASLQPSDSL